jgi:Two component regulator propeller
VGGLGPVIRRTLLAALLVGGAAGRAYALDPHLLLTQLIHKRWTAEEGAPSRIYALSQDRKGFLWIGGGDGLYRFDGATFEKIPAPEDAEALTVTALLRAQDGTIWIGYMDGHLAVYRDGAVRDASTPLSDNYVLRLEQTSDGVIWAVLGRDNAPLLRYFRGSWKAIDASWGLPPLQIIEARAFRDGSLLSIRLPMPEKPVSRTVVSIAATDFGPTVKLRACFAGTPAHGRA